MAFQIKDFKSILASMVNWCRGSRTKLTDFSVGSVNRTILEAPAAELDELYQNMFIGLKESIPVSIYQAFSFDLLPTTYASGLLTFEALVAPAADILIPLGTSVKSSSKNIFYETSADAYLLTGETSVTVLATAKTPGLDGNASAASITELQVAISGIDSVTNTVAFNNGSDQETELERKSRFQSYISTIARGIIESIKYGAETSYLTDSNGFITEKVVMAVTEEPYKTDPSGPIALVNLYIHNGIGSTSSNLVTQTQKIIDGYIMTDGTPVVGWKAAGVPVHVYAAADIIQDVTAELVILSGYSPASVITEVESMVSGYLAGLKIGEQVIRNEIIDIIMSVDGVYDLTLSEPSANTTITAIQKLLLGTLDITEAA